MEFAVTAPCGHGHEGVAVEASEGETHGQAQAIIEPTWAKSKNVGNGEASVDGRHAGGGIGEGLKCRWSP